MWVNTPLRANQGESSNSRSYYQQLYFALANEVVLTTNKHKRSKKGTALYPRARRLDAFRAFA